MDKIELVAEKRSVLGKANKKLRVEGKVPAVIYGHGVASQPVTVDSRVMERVWRTAGGNKIISLKVADGRARNVLIHDVQVGRAQDQLTHVDFYVVRMDEVLKTEIPLHFTGESKAVFQDEGTLVKNLETVGVECLPGDLPEVLEVDLSSLDDFEKAITLADISVPEGVKLLEENLDTIVAKVEPPRTEAEMEELDEAVTEELPEGVQEEEPVVVSEENEGDKDRRDKK